MSFGHDHEGDKNSLFFCLHPLLEWEEGYIICPSCGKLIDKHSEDSWIEEETHRSISCWLEKILGPLILLSIFILGIIVSRFFLSNGQYGINSFIVPGVSISRRKSEVELPIIIISCFFGFFLGWREKYRRTFLSMFKLDRFYDLWFSWPVQLVIYLLVLLWISTFFDGFVQTMADSKLNSLQRYYALTQEQVVGAREVYIKTVKVVSFLTSLEILVYNFVVTAKAKYIRQLNDEYLEY